MEIKYREFSIALSRRAADICDSAWTLNAAKSHPFKGIDFLTALENIFPDRQFRYASLYLQGRLVGQVVLTLDRIDATMFSPSWVKACVRSVRRCFPSFLKLSVLTVGTMETLGAHWWWDREAVPKHDMASIIEMSASRAFPQAHLLVVRDFLASDRAADGLVAELLKQDLVQVAGLPVASIRTHLSSDAYFSSLPRRVRKSIRKLSELERQARLDISVVKDFQGLISECYPLFMNVHERSVDLQREPIPIEFFKQVAMLPNSRMTIARGPEGRIVGFILTRTVGSISCPFAIGLDYSLESSVRLYHQLLWAEIVSALDSGSDEIDLGVTSYFVKQGFGATLDPSSMMVRFQRPFVRRLFNRFIPTLLKVEQPTTRKRRSAEPNDEIGVDAGAETELSSR